MDPKPIDRTGCDRVGAVKYGPRTLRAIVTERRRQKVFVIGRNKSGTSTICDYLAGRGLVVGSEAAGERLLEHWTRRDFDPIVRFCRRAQVFKDIPFSYPFTFQAMDQAFPGSKFVLSVWPSADDWYSAFTGFHARQFGGGNVPTADQLRMADYRDPGFVLETLQLLYGTSDESPYDRDTLIEQYNRHVDTVQEYFAHRPDDLIVLDIGAPGGQRALCRFLGLSVDGGEFPIGRPDVGAEEVLRRDQ